MLLFCCIHINPWAIGMRMTIYFPWVSFPSPFFPRLFLESSLQPFLLLPMAQQIHTLINPHHSPEHLIHFQLLSGYLLSNLFLLIFFSFGTLALGLSELLVGLSLFLLLVQFVCSLCLSFLYTRSSCVIFILGILFVVIYQLRKIDISVIWHQWL